ncbi:hypothetical protein RhiirA5_407896 [Rhizophagus irregularis]|uniref:Uncharacterized protein n=1 Tax=Rhizophagus irregularis TaxID=588596 RepID=A0A2N0Q9E9_9GLOM|nr:hypothetical protein RhiirA5_407896 [Rhizophagus irregularis]
MKLIVMCLFDLIRDIFLCSTRAKLAHELAQAFQAEPSQAMIKLAWWLTSQLGRA